jgi:DNA topoisomerase-1
MLGIRTELKMSQSDMAADMPSLRYVPRASLTIRRRRCGRGFAYFDGHGNKIEDPATLRRIRTLAIPPAYRKVRIARQPSAHLQAVGRDDAGRLQYRYHPAWDVVRERKKEDRLEAICSALPSIRRRVARDLRRPGLGRERVLAAVVSLIEKTHIRIGCEDYVHSGRSRGAATLTKQNVRCDGDRVRLRFFGKGRREMRCEVVSAPLARAIAALRRLPGARIFQYRDDDGRLIRVTATDVNRYLQKNTTAAISAKDFRTLAATAAAAALLIEETPASSLSGRRKQVAAVVRKISRMLGNTPAVVRKSYVHANVIDAFFEGKLQRCGRRKRAGLRYGETIVRNLAGSAGQ